MIYINYDGPASPMLHTKFRGNWPEDFLKVFAIYSHGGHLGHVTWTVYINFRSHLLCLYSSFCVRPGWKAYCRFPHDAAHFIFPGHDSGDLRNVCIP